MFCEQKLHFTALNVGPAQWVIYRYFLNLAVLMVLGVDGPGLGLRFRPVLGGIIAKLLSQALNYN